MKDLLQKISSYNFFNYLLPGVLFAVIGGQITSYRLLTNDIIIGIFVYYFLGLVISRVGSIVLNPLLELIRFIKPMPYADFIIASKTDDKIELLSEINNMYRTLASLSICLLLLMFFEFLDQSFAAISSNKPFIALVFLTLLFITSLKKQTRFLKNRIEHAIKSGGDHQPQ